LAGRLPLAFSRLPLIGAKLPGNPAARTLEVVLAEVEEGHLRAPLGADAAHHDIRDQDLIAVGRAFQPIYRRQSQPEEIIATRARKTNMHAPAHLKPPSTIPLHRAHFELGLDSCEGRVHRSVEHGDDAIAGVFERDAATAVDRAGQDFIMHIHRGHHVVGMAAMQSRAADDVGGQERMLSYVAA
jgi:hypothetical protein